MGVYVKWTEQLWNRYLKLPDESREKFAIKLDKFVKTSAEMNFASVCAKTIEDLLEEQEKRNQ